MPGKNDPSLPGASYISDWELYRSDIEAADAIDTSAHIKLIPTLDLSRNANGLANQIWVHPHLTSGTGTVTLGLYQANNGAWASIADIVLVDAQVSQADKSIFKWTGLLAGIYYIALTAPSGGAKWDLYTCHT